MLSDGRKREKKKGKGGRLGSKIILLPTKKGKKRWSVYRISIVLSSILCSRWHAVERGEGERGIEAILT